MSVIAAVADEIVSKVNGGSFSQSFTAVRAYVHSTRLKDNDALAVYVAPKDASTEWLARGERQRELTFYASVMKRLPQGFTNADVDSLVALVEEIDGYLSNAANRLITNGSFVSSELVPPVDGRHLIEWGQFTGVIEVTYRVKA